MKPVPFKDMTHTITKHQPPYNPLPAYHNQNIGLVVCCWKLSWRERLEVLLLGTIWHQIKTFNQPLQPQMLTTTKPVLK